MSVMFDLLGTFLPPTANAENTFRISGKRTYRSHDEMLQLAS